MTPEAPEPEGTPEAAEVDAVAEAAAVLAERLPAVPEIVLVLGSGLKDVGEALTDPVDVPVVDLPGIPVTKVPGHDPSWRFGTIEGRPVLAQRGRVHLYEGFSAREVVRGVEVAARTGASTLVVTNAAGGLDTAMSPGQLLLLSDQINLTGRSPLTGAFVDDAPVFLDMGDAYDADLRKLATEVATSLDIALDDGVYAGLPGPQYETPAEVAMLRTLGADAVGMSTVLEVIAARAAGMRVLGVSSITNVHSDGADRPGVSHAEVVEVGARAAKDLSRLLLELVPRL